jgi:hypothetical protein
MTIAGIAPPVARDRTVARSSARGLLPDPASPTTFFAFGSQIIA